MIGTHGEAQHVTLVVLHNVLVHVVGAGRIKRSGPRLAVHVRVVEAEHSKLLHSIDPHTLPHLGVVSVNLHIQHEANLRGVNFEVLVVKDSDAEVGGWAATEVQRVVTEVLGNEPPAGHAAENLLMSLALWHGATGKVNDASLADRIAVRQEHTVALAQHDWRNAACQSIVGSALQR